MEPSADILKSDANQPRAYVCKLLDSGDTTTLGRYESTIKAHDKVGFKLDHRNVILSKKPGTQSNFKVEMLLLSWPKANDAIAKAAFRTAAKKK